MRSFKLLAVVSALSAMASMPACSCSNAGGAADGFRPGGDGMVQIGGIDIAPNDVTLDLYTGQAPPQQAFTVTYHSSNSDMDVTAASIFTLQDPTAGTMSANTFIAGTAHGGTTTLIASYTPMGGSVATAQATIHVRVHGSFQGPDCTGNAACNMFPPDSAPACAASAAPTIVYPNDGALLPPNLNTMDVQFMPGSGDTVYEIDFENAATDVRITTTCATHVKDTRMVDTGGCELDFAQVMGSWDFIVKSNAGGDPVKITVRATTDGTCAIPSSNATSFSVAEQPINGGIYYWQSTIAATSGGAIGGEIQRFAFGDVSLMSQTIAPPPTNGGNFTCEGCHFLSRDGVRMTLSGDDNDSDDEYGDVSMGLVDVGKAAFISNTGYGTGEQPGFQSFNPDHSLYVASNGEGLDTATKGGGGGGNAPSGNVFFLFDGATGASANPAYALIGTDTMMRPTMPDWSPDGSNVLYVNTVGSMATPMGGSAWFTNHRDDAHVFGGSIFSVPYMGMGKFGAPTVIIQSNGDNNYYPSYSPDGKFMVYNHVPLQGSGSALATCTPPTGTSKTGGSCPNDSFSNPKARMMILPNGATMPADLEMANGSPAAMPVDVSNSWPKWSPFIQMYKGNALLWLTFSSTRDYGLHVRNHTMVNGQAQIQCYPSDTPETYPNTSHGAVFDQNCQSPNIWMAAINLTKAGELMNTGGDPSYPAFWLPYQAIVDNKGNPTHNHAAQWVQTVVTMPPPTDGGACIAAGQNCTANPTNCCADAPVCTAAGTCGIP
jgi:hypothetical protein